MKIALSTIQPIGNKPNAAPYSAAASVRRGWHLKHQRSPRRPRRATPPARRSAPARARRPAIRATSPPAASPPARRRPRRPGACSSVTRSAFRSLDHPVGSRRCDSCHAVGERDSRRSIPHAGVVGSPVIESESAARKLPAPRATTAGSRRADGRVPDRGDPRSGGETTIATSIRPRRTAPTSASAPSSGPRAPRARAAATSAAAAKRTPVASRIAFATAASGGHDRRLADAAHAVGVRADSATSTITVSMHRQVRGHRHAVVEEARVLHHALGIPDVLLVQRPADALRRAALHLALDVARVHGLAGVLDRGVADDLGCGRSRDRPRGRRGAPRSPGRPRARRRDARADDRPAGRRPSAPSIAIERQRLVLLAAAFSGIALPSSHFTSSSAQPQIFAARSRSCRDRRRARPRSRPCRSRRSCGCRRSGRSSRRSRCRRPSGASRSTGMPSSSAAMIAIDAREPPMSGLPVRTTAEPSMFTETIALDCRPALNQKPRRCRGPGSSRAAPCSAGASSRRAGVSTSPIGPYFGP